MNIEQGQIGLFATRDKVGTPGGGLMLGLGYKAGNPMTIEKGQIGLAWPQGI